LVICEFIDDEEHPVRISRILRSVTRQNQSVLRITGDEPDIRIIQKLIIKMLEKENYSIELER